MRRAICLIAFLAAGCHQHKTKPTPWRVHGQLPPLYEYNTRCTYLLNREVGFFGGNTEVDSFDQNGKIIPHLLRARREKAVIYRWNRGAVELVYRGVGRIESIDGYQGSLWALAAMLNAQAFGSDYRLLWSGDEGKTWQEAGPIVSSSDLPSFRLVQGIDRNEAWALGVDEFARTTDRGKTWQPIVVPDRHSTILENITRTASHGIALFGNGIQMTSDRGHSWRRLLPSEVEVRAFDGDSFVAKVEDQYKLGTLINGQVRWSSPVSIGTGTPHRLTVRGPTVRIVTSEPTHYDAPIFESQDGGRHFAKTTLQLMSPSEEIIDLHDDAGLAVDGYGQIWALQQPF